MIYSPTQLFAFLELFSQNMYTESIAIHFSKILVPDLGVKRPETGVHRPDPDANRTDPGVQRPDPCVKKEVRGVQ